MQLPDFIKRVLGFVEKAEANLTATEQLAAANARIAELQAENETLKAASSGFDIQIKNLTGEVEAKDDALKKLQAQLDAARATANNVIASQGLPIDQIPSSAANPSVTGTVSNPLADLRKRLAEATDPKEKYRLAMAIRELLSPSSKNSSAD